MAPPWWLRPCPRADRATDTAAMGGAGDGGAGIGALGIGALGIGHLTLRVPRPSLDRPRGAPRRETGLGLRRHAANPEYLIRVVPA